MPPGTPYNSFIVPYSIRVDEFSSSPSMTTVPALHLLSHTHSDHIVGLSAKSFSSIVICSPDAKEMLLRHEVYNERSLRDRELRSEAVRTFKHLKVDPVISPDGQIFYQGSRDLLKAIPLHTPTSIEICNNESVTVTLFDANHCPGAVMFLIEGSKGNILHTGDLRAESWFIDALSRNPLIQRYVEPRFPQEFSEGWRFPDYIPDRHGQSEGPMQPLQRAEQTLGPGKLGLTRRILDAIYLDTACVFSTAIVPDKQSAVSGLIELIALFPPTTSFFINSWTWGYEDILKGIAAAYECKIHVDRYKHGVYSNLSDPFMKDIITRKEASTRFHACERFDRCKYVPDVRIKNKGIEGERAKEVVYINPVTMTSSAWHQYLEETKRDLKRGDEIRNLLVPLSRHSPLPELMQFVNLFKPRRVVPNTLTTALGGLDWLCIEKMFRDCVYSESDYPSPFQAQLSARDESILKDTLSDDVGDAALVNLEGEDSVQTTAEKWAESGKLTKKLEVMRSYLTGKEEEIVRKLLKKAGVDVSDGLAPSSSPAGEKTLTKKKSNKARTGWDSGSDEDTDDDDDERGRTAHRLFFEDGFSSQKESTNSSPMRSEVALSPLKTLSANKIAESKPAIDKDTKDPLPFTPQSSPHVKNPIVSCQQDRFVTPTKDKGKSHRIGYIVPTVPQSFDRQVSHQQVLSPSIEPLDRHAASTSQASYNITAPSQSQSPKKRDIASGSDIPFIDLYNTSKSLRRIRTMSNSTPEGKAPIDVGSTKKRKLDASENAVVPTLAPTTTGTRKERDADTTGVPLQMVSSSPERRRRTQPSASADRSLVDPLDPTHVISGTVRTASHKELTRNDNKSLSSTSSVAPLAGHVTEASTCRASTSSRRSKRPLTVEEREKKRKFNEEVEKLREKLRKANPGLLHENRQKAEAKRSRLDTDVDNKSKEPRD